MSERKKDPERKTLNRNQRAAARQLSLVAYLLYDGGGERRNEGEIRDNLPLYESVYAASLGDDSSADRASDALRKQLQRDVEALAGIGVRIEVEGDSEGRLYRLPVEGFSPVELELSPDERAVLTGALRALRRDFPYAGPLRLALANLIGAVSDGGEALAVVATREDEGVARRVAVLERAIARRKRVTFDYYSIARDEVSGREVEPHALSFVDGLWYMRGYDTDREAVRRFRISRVKSLVKYATRRESGDFATPDEPEDPEGLKGLEGSRAPWQLEDPANLARIRVSGETLDFVLGAYPQAFRRAESASGGLDGAIVETRYSGERQLAGWTLSVGGEALSPDSLVERVVAGLERVHESHKSSGSPEIYGESKT